MASKKGGEPIDFTPSSQLVADALRELRPLCKGGSLRLVHEVQLHLLY